MFYANASGGAAFGRLGEKVVGCVAIHQHALFIHVEDDDPVGLQMCALLEAIKTDVSEGAGV